MAVRRVRSRDSGIGRAGPERCDVHRYGVRVAQENQR